MASLEDFTLNTDYGSLKNDDATSVIITVPASSTVAGNSIRRFTQDITIGSPFGLLNLMIKNNRSGTGSSNPGGANRFYVAGIQLSYTRTGKADGNDAVYSVMVYAYHISQNTVRCVVEIMNPYSVTLTTATQSDAYTLNIRTLLLPDM